MLKDSNIQDWLFNYLSSPQDETVKSITDKLLFPESFMTLKDVAMEEKNTDLLVKYLTKEWYCEDCGCFEAHKSKQNIYYGYWSFESGAFVKILNIDDTSLKNVQYYPYDLVHF